jgi:hypothetical protein
MAGTVIAGFGRLQSLRDFQESGGSLGWRILAPSDNRFHLERAGGLLRTDAAVGLPHLEQAYAMDGREGLIGIVQEPESYVPRTSEGSTQATIGPFEGEIKGALPHGSFVFFSGEEIAGQRIRVQVYANRSSDITEEEFRAFVASLALEATFP